MKVPGLSYVSEWLTAEECDALVAHADAAEWERTLRRRVQHYGHRYDYVRRTVSPVPAPPIPDWIAPLVRRLADESRMAEPNQVIVNEYQPGQGISAHVDCVPCFGPVVATVSLGSACEMDFTHAEDGRRAAVPLAVGSLCLLAGDARHLWEHGIAPRRSDPGPAGRVPRSRRVSLTFRTIPPARDGR
ncbi:2OG-Fe(II) oxygenase [Stackebrandtia soli]